MKLSKKAKRKWLNALRSGKYKQGTGSLLTQFIDDDGQKRKDYCCLGVACSIGIANPEGGRLDGGSFCTSSFLPKRTQTTLANINDASNDFEEVIRYISKNL